MSTSTSFEENDLCCTPPDIRCEALNVMESLLPENSKENESKVFRKYLVQKNSITNCLLTDICFCFKESGKYQKVPEILNQDNNNLERLIVYLYRDKKTNIVKLYIPNDEKQALVPDLAFEVGDKLRTVDDDYRVIYLFKNIPYIDGNKMLPTETTTTHKTYYNRWINKLPLYDDTERDPSEKVVMPDDTKYEYPDDTQYEYYPDHSHEQTYDNPKHTDGIFDNNIYDEPQFIPQVDLEKLPLDGKNIPSIDNNNPKPQVDLTSESSEEENKSDEIEYGDYKYPNHYHYDSNTISSEETNSVPSKPLNIYKVDTPDYFESDDSKDFNGYYPHDSKIISSREVILPDGTVNIDEQQKKPNVYIDMLPSQIVDKPSKPDFIDNNGYHYYYPSDSKKISPQEVNLPVGTVNIDGQQKKPNVYIDMLPSQIVDKPSKPDFIDNNGYHYYYPYDSKIISSPEEVNIPDEAVNIDGQQKKPNVYIDMLPSQIVDKPSKPDFIDNNGYHYYYPYDSKIISPQEVNIPDEAVNIDGQQKKPNVYIDMLPSQIVDKPSKPDFIDNNGYHYYYPYDSKKISPQEVNLPDGTVNIDGQQKKPNVYIDMLPSQIVDKPSKPDFIDNNGYHYYYPYDSKKISPQEVNLPDGTVNIDGQQKKPNVYIDMLPSQIVDKPSKPDFIDNNGYHYYYYPYDSKIISSPEEVNIPDGAVNIDGQQKKPNVYIDMLPSQIVDKPSKPNFIDNNGYHYYYPYDSKKISPQEVNLPVGTVNIDGQQKKPNVYIDMLPSEIVDKPSNPDFIDNNGYHYYYPYYPYDSKIISPQEVNIPDEAVNIDGQQIKPNVYIDMLPSQMVDKPSKPEYIDNNYYYPYDSKIITPQEVNIPDEAVNIDGQQIKPNVYIDMLPSQIVDKPSKPEYIDSNYYYPHDSKIITPQKVIIPDGTVNIDGQQKKPNVYIDMLPSQIVDKPSKPEYIDNNYYYPYDSKIISTQVVNKPHKTINIDGQDIKPYEFFDPIEIDSSEENNKQSAELSSESNEAYFDSNESLNNNSESIENTNVPPIHHGHYHYKTFDRWFIQQMQRFKTYTEHDRAVNLQIIERFILKILNDNDMHVTSEGVLTDSFGTALDVRNLHLRPILIGKTMAFGTILTDKVKDLVIPANMAYLQAILITNSNPSMILGIIPIGKTVIPPSAVNAFSNVLKPYVPSEWRHNQNFKYGPTLYNQGKTFTNYNTYTGYNIGENKPILQHPSRYRQKPVHKKIITHKKQLPILVETEFEGGLHPIRTVRFHGAKGILGKDFVFSKESGEAFKNMIISLRMGKDPIESADATNKLLASLRSGHSSVLSVPKKDEVNADEDVRPNENVRVDEDVRADEDVSADEDASGDENDITGRILGGRAATSSGTPLSIKGRMKDF